MVYYYSTWVGLFKISMPYLNSRLILMQISIQIKTMQNTKTKLLIIDTLTLGTCATSLIPSFLSLYYSCFPTCSYLILWFNYLSSYNRLFSWFYSLRIFNYSHFAYLVILTNPWHHLIIKLLTFIFANIYFSFDIIFSAITLILWYDSSIMQLRQTICLPSILIFSCSLLHL